MPARLIIDKSSGTETLECATIVTIGRDTGCDIVLADPKVSRNHAMLRQLGGGDFYLIDEGSSNGSYINNRLITAPTQLNDQDRITIGGTEMTFEHQAEVGTEADGSGEDTILVMPTGEIRRYTILVADIRGYTTISETTPIRILTKMMNEWFNRTRECIYQHHGVVDKFIGDCVYARWEVHDDVASTVIDALAAACELDIISRDMKTHFPEVKEPLKIGVGINTGSAALGVGVTETAIGDAVNLTFRLESSSKELGKDIIVGRSAYEFLPDGLWTQQQVSITVKGKSDPVDVWAMNFADAGELLGRFKTSRFN